MTQESITLIGGGLVGALLAQQLARRGLRVDVFEKRDDPRQTRSTAGRSINLALAERGLRALRSAGLAEQVLAQAVMMRGRMVHDREGVATLQRYGVDDSEVIWSVSRDALNVLLLDAAEAAGVKLHFGQSLSSVDFAGQTIRLTGADGTERQRASGLLIGADGAGSALRSAMNANLPLGERVESLGHGYKELEIPPAARLPAALASVSGGRDGFVMEPHALHIWPRGGYMCIALPNAEGSFTVTLFLPMRHASVSFDSLPGAAGAAGFFSEQFPGLLSLIPDFVEDYDNNPVGNLSTLYLEHWHLQGRALLVGDAAHAIVPFHGQGMNCGFEDTTLLTRLLAENRGDSADVFAEFQRLRQPDCDAIARMALENYIEMRDSVADPHYLAKRDLGALLSARIPTHYMARYRMVTFTGWSYAYALERGRAQDILLERLLDGCDNASEVDVEAAVKLFEENLAPLPPRDA